jgi:hypothetical protein
MNKLTFWNGVVFALLGSLIGSIGFFALTLVFSEDCAIRLLTSGLALAYILYLLINSQERTGRITVLGAGIILWIMLWIIYPPLTVFIVLHVLAIWLIRSLYWYASLISSLADLGLNALSFASAFWALHHSGSLFLTFWCFFLVQALFVYIPTGIKKANLANAVIPDSESDFNRAYQTAEAAVRKLSTFN